MSTAMMSAPSCASRTACDRPWPRAAPVMKATLPSSFPATYVTPFTDARAAPTVPGPGSGSGTEAGQRILVAGTIRSVPDRPGSDWPGAGGPAADGHRHRPGTVRMIAERSGHGGPGDGRERALAVPLDALRVGAVQRQPGEELGRHAPAAARVVGRTRLAGAPGLRPAQPGEQLGIPPHRGESAGAADVPGQEVLVDGERARVDVADRVDQADHPARAAQVQARQRVAVGGQVKERVAGQHLLAAGLQPVVELPLLG